MSFSRSESTRVQYEQRIDELFAGAKANLHGAIVLDRSDLLDMLGYGDMPVQLDEAKVLLNQKNHPEMTADAWKRVPEWLDNPAAVLKSRTHDKRLVFVPEEMMNGAPVYVIVEPDTKGLRVHALVNAYTKDGNPAQAMRDIERDLRNGHVDYVNKEKARELLGRSGLQLPRLPSLNTSRNKILTEKNLQGYLKNNPALSVSHSGNTFDGTSERLAQLRQQVQQAVGAANMRHIDIVSRADLARPDNAEKLRGAEGFYDPTTRRVTLIAEALPNARTAQFVAWHELGHRKMDVSGWQDSADYDIGDDIPFRLQGTVSKDIDSYKTYYYAFHDVEEAGLTFDPDSVEVFVGDEVTGTKITTGYTVDTSPADGCTFEIVFDDLKKVSGVTANSIITVTYKSQLNGNAVLGEHGNVNKAQLEYSNNPRGDGKGETPWDNVIVFTYKVVVNKIDQAGDPLEGAQFTLTKKTKNGTDVVKTMDVNTTLTQFTLSGLDDGEYTLTETVTPAHYNTISPITFTVNADHTITWEADPRNTVLTSLSGNTASGEITFTHNETDGSLTTDVVNNIGTTLPGTGGIGTTIFYVIGGGLMVAAAILLITKKRMENR